MTEKELKLIELCDKLRKMKMSAMSSQLQIIGDDPNLSVRNPLDILETLIQVEWDNRYEKKLNRFLKQATLKIPSASLDERIYNPERMIDTELVERLSTCQWIAEAKSLTITGKAGTGKTYIACALAICALQKFISVKYTKASTMLNEIEIAYHEGRILDCQNKLSNYDLLIIDDFGFMNLNIENCLKLFEILDAREARKSTVVISQLPREKWYELFADSTFADACMERLIKGFLKLELNGPSLRS